MEPAHQSVRQNAVDALYFVGHVALSTLGVGFVAAVMTYSVVFSLHLFFPSLTTRTVHWILTETPYFPVQIVVGLLWGFQLGRRYQHRVMLWILDCPRVGHQHPDPICAATVCCRLGSRVNKDPAFLRFRLSAPKPLF